MQNTQKLHNSQPAKMVQQLKTESTLRPVYPHRRTQEMFMIYIYHTCITKVRNYKPGHCTICTSTRYLIRDLNQSSSTKVFP